MRNKYYVFNDGESVHISMKDDKECLNAFLDIYLDEPDTPSPLRTVKDAILFAEIIVKLLEQVT